MSPSSTAGAPDASGPVRYLDLARPEPGRAVEVAPGLLWARVPLPFKLDHVNVWLLEDAGGWTLVDTGIADAVARDCWSALLDEVLAGAPVTRVLVTHFHPDHVGCAPWLLERTGAALWMTRPEWLTARLLAIDTAPEMVDHTFAFYAAAGSDPDHLDYVRRRGAGYAALVDPLPRSHRALVAGQELRIGARDWQVVVEAGHAPAHACLWCKRDGILIAGDQILPRISPNVSVGPTAPGADPLADFMAALDRFAEWPGDPLVLPSHDAPFHGLQGRARQLTAHHDERLAAALKACESPASVREIAAALFDRALDRHQTGFAIGETLAHVNRLAAVGQVATTTDADGVWRVQASAGAGTAV
jgi:glyoxylase-like metal-dependent hydrolase (beta-lactamase superfamily II)